MVLEDLSKWTIRGLTGSISGTSVVASAAETIEPIAKAELPEDIDLKRMAEWALHYLVETPKKELDYEPVFQCHPLQCPPVSLAGDPVVACDTDARMDWEWYYMRDITSSTKGKDVEEAFHKRMRSYIASDGVVWAHPGCYNEEDIDAQYGEDDQVIHIWGATKILQSLSEDYVRTGSLESKELARKVMKALKKLAIWDDNGRCWFSCGMGALRRDLTAVPNGWNRQPAPIVEPLVTYWLATEDAEALEFAEAYTEGVINTSQPGGVTFEPDGSFKAHSHATMHALWGIAHLGLVTGKQQYIDFVKRSWEYMSHRGTGTGWFPAAMDDSCNETCCISDMMSIAALIAQSGCPEYFDYVERYLRNYISNLQFIVTPEFEIYYRELNKDKGEEAINKGLADLRKFQGGVLGGSGLSDFENELLGGNMGYEMFGCCAPEGMRAIYTSWLNAIDRYDESKLGPAGVHVNMSLSRQSKWGSVTSFMPDQGRVTVTATMEDAFFLRPPHWVPHDQVRAFVGTVSTPVKWSGDYVQFDAKPGDELTITYPLIEFVQQLPGYIPARLKDVTLTYRWRGNMVIDVSPEPKKTPLFLGRPRQLPALPD